MRLCSERAAMKPAAHSIAAAIAAAGEKPDVELRYFKASARKPTPKIPDPRKMAFCACKAMAGAAPTERNRIAPKVHSRAVPPRIDEIGFGQ